MACHDDVVAHSTINIDYKNKTLSDEYRPVKKAGFDIWELGNKDRDRGGKLGKFLLPWEDCSKHKPVVAIFQYSSFNRTFWSSIPMKY